MNRREFQMPLIYPIIVTLAALWVLLYGIPAGLA